MNCNRSVGSAVSWTARIARFLAASTQVGSFRVVRAWSGVLVCDARTRQA